MTMTIEQISDRIEVADLRLRFAAYLDNLEWDRLNDILTEDCIFDYPAYYQKFGIWRGRDNIIQNIAAAMKGASPFAAMHLMTNPLIELHDAQRASGRWYLVDYITQQTLLVASPGGATNPLIWIGVYDDEYVKENGAWKISHVKLTFHWPERHLPVSMLGSDSV